MNSNLDSSEHIYRYQVRDEDIPELLVNLSSLVDQHRELENHGPEIIIEQCLSPKEILETFGINQTSSLNPVSFLHLCPAIIYELDQGHCMFRSHAHKKSSGVVTMDQWMYSCLAVIVISLCGLLSVAVIPIMQKWFYHTLLQFLVGLAIGSLSGDALLHLMPHAMLGGEGAHSHDSSIAAIRPKKTAIWRGFAALGGIFFFFIAERLLGALTAARKQKKEEDSKMFQAVFSNSLGDDVSHGIVGKKLSHYKRNSTDLVGNEKELTQMLKPEPYMMSEYSLHDSTNYPIKDKISETKVTVTEHKGHGHGHSHEVPESVSAVAWMVIMGDGLHNFCDGLAIGAAFAFGVEGGISTSVAVFCHELPHELGDFAMLLKTGMKVKQALFYNLLSSVLCFVGMVIGVSLGNVHSATSWVFAGTAGMFLYIALVDMLPELSSVPHEQSSVAYQLAVQVLGISTGISIMLLIANYEQDLQAIIS
ncbi:LOW QUALITY PROTEIN: zinc transporter ZIP10-like [Uloborus diversus]|uniref:LOW QUALITY PROTEIN: zinc transporter ZIP10-like n=1 Tax=Uloborus diversus TaxID=327109 RepID=UPI0024092A4F|nr:LOW QUALITY PROTEIN: zinc transporter ZIP10-like [Uloborus diversus]